jgi:tetratricopeptide (TPR) repeat protein
MRKIAMNKLSYRFLQNRFRYRASACAALLVGSFLLLTGCPSAKDSETEALPETTPPEKRTYEAISLLGDTLYAPALPEVTQTRYDSALRVAQRNYRQDSTQLENVIWLGRRLGYLSRYQDAIRVFTEGIKRFPGSAEVYRHRGHRYITLRQFDRAVADLSKSAALLKDRPRQVEPNGIPVPLPANDRPTSLQFNVYYHLGLAHYLNGDYGPAAQAYERTLAYAESDDDRVAVADWLYMTYRRLGEDEVAERTLAQLREDMDVRENEGYLERLLMYAGYVDADSLLRATRRDNASSLSSATLGYGVGNYLLSEGDTVRAQQVFNEVIDGQYWAAFGYIAAEADLARQRNE